MQSMNKRGVSGIVATMLLIILSVVFVSILGASIINLIQKSTFAPEYSCGILQSKNLIQIQETCYNEDTNEIEIILIRSNDNSIFLNSIEFSIKEDINTTSWECGISCNNCKVLNAGNTRKYFFEGNGNEKSITIKTNNCVLETKNIVKC